MKGHRTELLVRGFSQGGREAAPSPSLFVACAKVAALLTALTLVAFQLG